MYECKSPKRMHAYNFRMTASNLLVIFGSSLLLVEDKFCGKQKKKTVTGAKSRASASCNIHT